MNELLVDALLADGRRVAAQVRMPWSGDFRAVMEVVIDGLPAVKGEEQDYFEALRSVRRQLDPLGVKLLVNGARRDVWASGMARDMGAGLRVYLTGGAKPAERLVDLLDPCDAALVGTVEEQDDFFCEWSGWSPSTPE